MCAEVVVYAQKGHKGSTIRNVSRNVLQKAIIPMTKSTSKQIELPTVTHVRNCDNEMTIKELGQQIPCSEIGEGLNWEGWFILNFWPD